MKWFFYIHEAACGAAGLNCEQATVKIFSEGGVGKLKDRWRDETNSVRQSEVFDKEVGDPLLELEEEREESVCIDRQVPKSNLLVFLTINSTCDFAQP